VDEANHPQRDGLLRGFSASTAIGDGSSLFFRYEGTLIRWYRAHFPGMSTRQSVPWTVLRPMMPDMLPRVARGRHPRVFYDTGHEHLGWTLSAATAEAVGALVTARANA